MPERGLIAAGSPHTARAGAEILEHGGNVIDAIVAAALATPIAEPGLSSLGGGGLLQYLAAGASEPTLCDFFADGPGLGASGTGERDFVAADLDFGPTIQRFHLGRASAAVPGFLPGVLSAWERWGRLPLGEVVAPACRLARRGATLDAFQAHACALHRSMLTHSEGVRRIFAPAGRLIAEGDLSQNPHLADTLEALAHEGWRRAYAEIVGGAILAEFGIEQGGLITESDMSHYEPRFCAALHTRYRGADVYLSPPPAAGGEAVALGLALLQDLDLGDVTWGGREHSSALISAMRVIAGAREEEGSPLAGAALTRWRRRFAEYLTGADSEGPVPAAGGPGHTTHISIVDRSGSAAAMTMSYGQGAGYAIGNTGIPMNNLMGEQDLHRRGFHRWPAGTRLATNMSPTVIREPAGDVTALGSGGSNRIRTAILQVIINLIDFAMPAVEAVHRSRVHWEGGILNIETFDRPPALSPLVPATEEQVIFPEPSLFFGGAHLARVVAGRLQGAGDPRRAGVAVAV